MDKKRIMIVDDDVDILEIISECLEDKFTVSAFLEGTEALSVVKKNPFDLVIVDLYLPGINGATLIKTIRTQAKMPILAISGYLTRDLYLPEALNLGATDFMEKPFTLKSFMNSVNSLLVFS